MSGKVALQTHGSGHHNLIFAVNSYKTVFKSPFAGAAQGYTIPRMIILADIMGNDMYSLDDCFPFRRKKFYTADRAPVVV